MELFDLRGAIRKLFFILSVSVFPSMVWAQTGPAGIGNISGTGGEPQHVLWLRGDVGVTQSSSRVSAWADQSGNGLVATQSTGTAQPLWTSANSNLNNQPSINFAPGGGYTNIHLAIPDNDLLDDGAGFSFFIAFRNATGSGPLGLLNKRTGTEANQSYRIYTNGTDLISNMSTSGTGVVTLGGVAANTSYLYSGIFDGALSGNKYTAYLSSVSSGSAAGPSVIPNNASPTYIGNFNLSDNRSFTGDIAEIIVYKTAVTTPERIILENYLSQKYSIAIGSNDLFGNGSYYSTAYDEGLTGIGSTDGTVQRTTGTSDALTLRETDGTIDAGEYALLAHNGVAHAGGSTANISDPEVTGRWARSWYIETTAAGVVDDAEMSMSLVFDFNTAGLTFSGDANDYVLLYREQETDDFTRVVATDYVVEATNKLVVSVPATRFVSGYYTLGEGTQLLANTWYVFQDGNWSDPTTWTLDASLTPIYNNPGSNTPGTDDNVLIYSGKKVTIVSTTNNLTVASVEVRGTLNLTSSTGHDFNRIDGNGIIRMSGYDPGSGLVDNFPAGSVESSIGFADATNGGTMMVQGAGDITLNADRHWKDLRITMSISTASVYLGADYLVRGNLEIRHGRFYFGDATAVDRTLTVEGNVLVEDNGSNRIGRIYTSAIAGTHHSFIVDGDFTNNGTVYFTNRTDFASTADRYNASHSYYTSSDNTGRVSVSFTNDIANQTVAINQTAYFSRIIVNKGSNATYGVDFQAADSAYFRLLGRANYNVDSDVTAAASNLNAFAIISGTAELNTNVIIPVLNNTGNYAVPSASRLWINGGSAAKTSGTAIVPYGTVEVGAGTLVATVGSGITLRANGKLKVTGGTVTLKAFRTSVQGTSAQGTYEQSGGTVSVLGGSGISNDYAVFSLTYTGNVFIMSGGTLNIQGRPSTGTSSTRGSVFINADVANQYVTGGTVYFISHTTTEYRITSRAPFYAVHMRATVASAGEFVLVSTASGSGSFPDSQTLAGQPLTVLNDLILEGSQLYSQPQVPTFRPVTSDANVNDVYIGGSFIIDRNAVYVPVYGGTSPYNSAADQPTAVNNTIFNQTSATSAVDTLYFGDTSGQLELGSFLLNRTSGNSLRTIGRSSRSDATIVFDVNGDATVQSGTLDQNRFTFRIWGNIINYDRMGTYYRSGSYPTSSGTPETAQIRFREDPPLAITTSSDAVFGNIRFNVGSGTTIELTSDVYIERMEYWNGRIYAKGYTLTVDDIWNWNNGGGGLFNNDIANSSLLKVTNTGPTGNIVVFTDGRKSDGGLRLKVAANTLAEDSTSRVNNTGPITFPVGFTLDGGTTIYYRPAQLKVADLVDDGYVQIRAVSGELTTSALSGGEILRHYWRVTHDGFTTLPRVAMRFYYRNRSDNDVVDLEVGNTQKADYVPGYVLDALPYTRYFESDPTEDKTDLQAGPNTNTEYIVFNGSDTNAEFTQAGFTGFTLASGNFTAGLSTRFVGAPTVYYSRLPDNSSWYDRAWQNGNYWSTVPHDGATNNSARPAAGTWPQAGDIAIIGYGGYTGGLAPIHSINIQNGDYIEVAEIVYNNASSNSTRLVVNGTATLIFGTIGGTGGTFMERRNSPSDASTITGDFGEFTSDNNFTYSYLMNGNGTYSISPATDVFPNLRIEGGNSNRIAIFDTDITVNNNLIVDGSTVLRTGPGNMTVANQLYVGGYLGGNLEFGTSTAVTVSVGAITLRGSSGTSNIRVLNTTPSALTHQLIVQGNIVQQYTGEFDLFNGNGASDNNVLLELGGEGTHTYTRTSGTAPDLYRVVMNKGTDQASSFSFDNSFVLNGPTGATDKALEIVNGTLILNDPAIDITLTSGGGDFLLPNLNNAEASSGSGALVLTQGVAHVSGASTGIVLDGRILINGGELDMDGGTGVDNYIEYRSSGNAHLEITDGVLTVGSQLRRITSSTAGIITYRQSGGRAIFAKNAAPTTSRGAFEVLNDGSEFTFTGGSFIINRQVNSTTVPTLWLEPEQATVGGRAIVFGSATTPTGQTNVGIHSSVLLDSVVIASANMTAKTYDLPLTVNHLVLNSGATFNPQNYALTINTSMHNDGVFTVSGATQTTYFPSTTTMQVNGSGTTTFNNLDKSDTGTLLMGQEVTVQNDALIGAGILNTQTYAFNMLGDLTFDATQTNDVGASGLIINGTQRQKLARSAAGTSYITTMQLDNAQGLVIEDVDQNFEISEALILESGVFDIGGNLLSFTEDAAIYNGSGDSGKDDFNVNRMIQTNSSINDFGVQKYFNTISSGSSTFTFPVGLTDYTPVVATIADINASSVTVRPVADVPPVPEDAETTGTCTDPEITDADNVLQYYWIIKSNGTTGLTGTMEMYYESSDVLVTSPYTVANYGPARLYNAGNTWDKVFTESQFDETNQRIEFPFTGNADATISGIYTAGVTLENDGTTLLCGAAIPDVVPQYITPATVTTGNFYEDTSYEDTDAPLIGSTPDITVQTGYTLVLDVNNIRTRKVTIESGATLEISGTNGHNLGFVTGEGTLKLVSNTSSVSFPAGDYQDFYPTESCVGGGGLEYAGTGSYSIPAGISTIRRLVLSGSGERVFPNNASIKLCEDLEIIGSVDAIVQDGNTTLTVLGNIYKSDAATFDNGGGNSSIVLNGTSAQQIAGAFTGTNALNRLEVDNTVGVTLVNTADSGLGISADADIDIASALVLTQGIVTTNAANVLRMLNGATISNYAASRYINGPLTRQVTAVVQSFPFPVGNGTRYGLAEIVSPTSFSGIKEFIVRYYSAAPPDDVYTLTANATANGVTKASGSEYWNINAVSPASSQVRLYWNAYSDVQSNISNLRMVYWNGSAWDMLATTSSPSGTVTTGSMTAGTLSYSNKNVTFATTNTAQTPLPVELTEFRGERLEGIHKLSWTTATEFNNDYFEVERKSVDTDFETIGTVAGSGTTKASTSYLFYDEAPVAGFNYYRLKQVDYDGTFAYSPIIMLQNTTVALPFNLLAYPNPASPGSEVTIRISLDNTESIRATLYTVNAKPIHTTSMNVISGNEAVMTLPKDLAAGVYVLEIFQQGRRELTKLVVR